MDKKKLAAVMEELRTNPEVLKELKEQKPGETLEEVSAAWAKAAAGLGHAITADEISDYIREAEEELRRRAQQAEDEIRPLSNTELDEVAGGKMPYEKCNLSYKDRENCWVADGCDNVNVMYPGYLCHKLFRKS